MDKWSAVQIIPVDKIHVLNPRRRDSKKFAQIVASILHVGLKKPIRISRRSEIEGDTEYDLVCGEGRLNAFIELKQKTIPAIVDDISREDRLLESLIENCARRMPRMLEMVRQVGALRDKGYSNKEIAKKIDLDDNSVWCLLRLLDQSEERLLQAVESGRIPISVAMIIASSTDKQLQKALSEAYEKGLRGKALLRARKLAEQRKKYGKQLGQGGRKDSKPITSDKIIRAFEQESKRQKLAIKRAEICDRQLLFIVNALRVILADEDFRNLLRAEQLNTLPSYLAERMGGV